MIMTIVIKVKNSPESFGAFLRILFITLTILVPRMSDNICHNICHKIFSHVTSGNDVIDNVTIAKLGFLVALTRFNYPVKNKLHS